MTKECITLLEDKNDAYEQQIVQILVEYDLQNQLLSFIRTKGSLFYTIPKNVKEVGRLTIKLNPTDTIAFLEDWINNIQSLSKISYEDYLCSKPAPDDLSLKSLVKVTHTFKWERRIVVKYHYNNNLSISLAKDHANENLGSSKDIKICPLRVPYGKYSYDFYLKKYYKMRILLGKLLKFLRREKASD